MKSDNRIDRLKRIACLFTRNTSQERISGPSVHPNAARLFGGAAEKSRPFLERSLSKSHLGAPSPLKYAPEKGRLGGQDERDFSPEVSLRMQRSSQIQASQEGTSRCATAPFVPAFPLTAVKFIVSYPLLQKPEALVGHGMAKGRGCRARGRGHLLWPQFFYGYLVILFDQQGTAEPVF